MEEERYRRCRKGARWWRRWRRWRRSRRKSRPAPLPPPPGSHNPLSPVTAFAPSPKCAHGPFRASQFFFSYLSLSAKQTPVVFESLGIKFRTSAFFLAYGATQFIVQFLIIITFRKGDMAMRLWQSLKRERHCNMWKMISSSSDKILLWQPSGFFVIRYTELEKANLKQGG